MATAAGVVLALTPPIGLIVIALFIVIAYLTRYVSLASILGALVAGPLAFWQGHVQPAELYLVLALLIALKHAANIRRLLTGTELKFGGSPSSGSSR